MLISMICHCQKQLRGLALSAAPLWTSESSHTESHFLARSPFALASKFNGKRRCQRRRERENRKASARKTQSGLPSGSRQGELLLHAPLSHPLLTQEQRRLRILGQFGLEAKTVCKFWTVVCQLFRMQQGLPAHATLSTAREPNFPHGRMSTKNLCTERVDHQLSRFAPKSGKETRPHCTPMRVGRHGCCGANMPLLESMSNL